MVCRTFRSDDGKVVGIVCSRGERSKPCEVCGARSTRLCDYPLTGSKLGKTCDRPMCDKHAASQGKDVDYCQTHARLVASQEPSGPSPIIIPDPLKAVTLWQPLSWAVTNAGKFIENRGWAPPLAMCGQRIAIHAGKVLDRPAMAELEAIGIMPPDHFVHGAIEAVAMLRGAIGEKGEVHGMSLAPETKQRILESKWFSGYWGWVLTDIRPVRSPVQCRGAQGLWVVPDDAASEVRSQFSEAA